MYGHCGEAKQAWLLFMRMCLWSLGLIIGLISSDAISCGISCRYDSDPAELWLCHISAAVVLIWPLAWEHIHAADAALKKILLIYAIVQFWLPGNALPKGEGQHWRMHTETASCPFSQGAGLLKFYWHRWVFI